MPAELRSLRGNPAGPYHSLRVSDSESYHQEPALRTPARPETLRRPASPSRPRRAPLCAR